MHLLQTEWWNCCLKKDRATKFVDRDIPPKSQKCHLKVSEKCRTFSEPPFFINFQPQNRCLLKIYKANLAKIVKGVDFVFQLPELQFKYVIRLSLIKIALFLLKLQKIIFNHCKN